MKKKYQKPRIALFPTKCHISTLSPNEPEAVNLSRRSLLMKSTLVATVSYITLYGASSLGNGNGNGIGNGFGQGNGNGGGNGNGNGWGNNK